MIWKIGFLIGIVLFFFSFVCHGQTKKNWSLEDCINYAIDNNIQVKQAKLGIDLARQNLLQSKANSLPRVNANVSHSYNFGRTVDQFTNDFITQKVQSNNFSMSGSVILFNGLRNRNSIKQNRHDLLASQWDSDRMLNDITLAIANNFMQILFNQELVAISENQVALSNEQQKVTSKLVQAGTLARGSLLDVEAQLAQDELGLLELNNQLEMSYLTLMQLLDLEYNVDFDIIKPAIQLDGEVQVLSTAGQIYDAAAANMPQIKSSSEKRNSAAVALAMAKGGHYPTISLGGSYGTGYSDARSTVSGINTGLDTLGVTTSGEGVLFPTYSYTYETTPFKDQIDDNLNKSIGFNMSIPLFNGLQTKTSISRARIALQNAEYTMELEKLQLKEDIQRSYMDAVAALKKYRASEKAVASYHEAFSYVKKKFDVGLVTALDFNEAKNQTGRIRSELAQAKYDFIFKTKLLEFYQGNPLVF